MKNVTINGKKYEKSGDTPIKLSNGTLVVHYNKLGDVMGAYMVTPLEIPSLSMQVSLQLLTVL